MKHLKVTDTYSHKNSENCIATEYDFKDKDIDLGTAVINGRYPEDGYCVNEKCKELVFVLEGKGTLNFKNKKIEFQNNEAILIDKNEPYFWGPDTNCKVAMVCTPAWSPEQHKLIKE